MQIHTLLSLFKKGRRHEVSAWEVYTLLGDREKTCKCQNFISSSTYWAPWEWGLCFLILHLQPTCTSDPATGMCLISNCCMAKLLWLWGLRRTSPVHSIFLISFPYNTTDLWETLCYSLNRFCKLRIVHSNKICHSLQKGGTLSSKLSEIF